MIKGVPLFIVLTIIFVAFYAIDSYYTTRYNPENQQGENDWDYVLFKIAIAMIVLLQPIIGFGLVWSVDALWGLVIQLVGGLLIILALCLHIWARRHLGRFYIERVGSQSDMQLIDSGPYRLVRHPIITSFLALTGGLLLLDPAITTGFLFVYTTWHFTHLGIQEEQRLSNSLPDYREYMDRTPRFLPRLGRNR